MAYFATPTKFGNFDQFPWWVVRPEGKPVYLDADWFGSAGFKYGAFLQGTGAAILRNGDHRWGGGGSYQMRTGNLTGNNAEVKIHMGKIFKGRVSFEMKWLPDNSFTANKFDFGIEPRSDHLIQGRMRFTASLDAWQIEKGIDSYFDLVPPADIIEPNQNLSPQGVGDTWGWARLVVNVKTLQYDKFECWGKDGILSYDLKGVPLVDRGFSSGTNPIMLFFTLGIAGANSNEDFFTTDWCIADLDP